MGTADKDKSQTPTAPRDDSGENALVFPLSFQQQRLWFLDELEPGNSTYNITWSIRETGMLNRSALEASISEVVRWHEILRRERNIGTSEPYQCWGLIWATQRFIRRFNQMQIAPRVLPGAKAEGSKR